jgi:hypothetical protein
MCDTLPHLVDGCVEEKWGQLCRYITEHTTLPLSVDGGTPCEWHEDLQQPTHIYSVS